MGPKLRYPAVHKAVSTSHMQQQCLRYIAHKEYRYNSQTQAIHHPCKLFTIQGYAYMKSDDTTASSV